MNKNSCAGPDGIPALFWNKLSFCLSYPLSMTFSASFSIAILPDDWLTANVTPIFKNEDPSSVSNYCPISLTCIPCKILETIVCNYIIDSLLEQNVITSRQHDFMRGHSTYSQLLECVNIWASTFERNVPVHVLYIDFKKAFDSASHKKVISNRNAYGLSLNIVNWISAFLSNRSQQEWINGKKCLFSCYKWCSGGISAWTFLFLLYIKALVNVINNSDVRLYADDVKLFLEIVDLHDVHLLQADLDNLFKWAQTWQLNISVNKCFSLYISRNKHDNLPVNFINNIAVPWTAHMRDIGVTISEDLFFSKHCDNIAKQARSRCVLIFK